MMTTRLAVGSVSTLAAGAMLLGAAPYLFNRIIGPSQSPPWGSISSLSVTSPAVASGDSDRAQLLKLAALKTSGAPAGSQADTVASAAVAPMPPAEVSPAVVVAPKPAAAPAQVVSVAPAPVKVAAVDPAPSTRAVDDRATADTSSPMLININTASAEALDRLPGAGRIGHAIVTHRPYRAINDLVRKRVLRTSDFQKIQSGIRVD